MIEAERNQKDTMAADILVRRTPPSPTVVYDTYWRFATERQAIYLRRFSQPVGPWTADPVLAEHKFTNAYRAADRVSQYLLRSVIYAGEHYDVRETIFRTILFKIFNRIETWELLQRRFGDITLKNFQLSEANQVLSDAVADGTSIYSAAYIMPAGPAVEAPSPKFRRPKHPTHLALLDMILNKGIVDQLIATRSLQELYQVFLSVPSFGPFLSYQYAIDLNYSEFFDFSENDFVQPGPGALNGLAKCFSSLGDYSAADAIAWVTDRQTTETHVRGLPFQTLFGRYLHRIDCQNLFCETDKYSRAVHPEFNKARFRIKQKFTASGPPPAPFFPPKWNLQVPDVSEAFSAVVPDGRIATRRQLGLSF